jgi:hypothetical protein
MQNQQPKKVKYNVQRYVQIAGVQYGAGLYEVPENIAAALDRVGAGARQEEFIQAVAGDAPVIDASAGAAQRQQSGQQTANLPSGIVPAFDGSPNAPDPNANKFQDSSAMNAGNVGNNEGNGQLQPQGYRTQVEENTVKTSDSNSQSFNDDASKLQASEGQLNQDATGGGNLDGQPGANQSQGGEGGGNNSDQQTQSKGATGDLPDDFPKVEELRAANPPIKTFEDLIPKTEKDLLAIPGIGKASVKEIGLAVYTAKQSENQ